MGRALFAIGIGVAAALVAVGIGVIVSNADDAADQEPLPTLVGPVWQWEALLSGDGTTIAPADPSDYTIEFASDGSIAVQADCNRGFGTYTEDGGSVEITVSGVTRAFCGDDSLSDRYLRDLGFVRTYVFDAGKLYLDLMADGGGLRHRQG
jgi:heat shock protein HslJ